MDEKTVKIPCEAQVQVLTQLIRNLEQHLASQTERIRALEQELFLYRSDQDLLANRCKALESQNQSLATRNTILSETVQQLTDTVRDAGLTPPAPVAAKAARPG